VDPRYYDRGFELSSFFIFSSVDQPARVRVIGRVRKHAIGVTDRATAVPLANNIWRIPARFPTIWSDEELPGSARNNVLFVAFHSWGSPGQGDNR
jgi:hypothetical protein